MLGGKPLALVLGRLNRSHPHVVIALARLGVVALMCGVREACFLDGQQSPMELLSKKRLRGA